MMAKFKLPKELIIRLYTEQNYTIREIAEKFNCSVHTLQSRLKDWNVHKDKTQIRRKSTSKLNLSKELLEDLYVNKDFSIEKVANTLNASLTAVSKYLKLYNIKKKVKNHKKEISKKELEELYLQKNFSSRSIAQQLHIAVTTVKKYIKLYGLFKSKELIRLSWRTNVIQTNLKKYGVQYSSQLQEVKDKTQQANLKKYGVPYPAILPDVREKYKKTMLKKYGVPYNFQVEECKEKIKQTNLKKYGVPYSCMREECQKLVGTVISKVNLKWREKLLELGYLISLEFKIENRAYDLFIQDSKILIEVNPIVTHNSLVNVFSEKSLPKPINYHYEKSKLATRNGFHCIHIWDWDNEDKVLNLLRKKNKIYARNTDIVEISEKHADEFNNLHHLQNTCKGQKVCLGLYYNDELISLMSFGKPRYNKSYQWELLRYTVHPDYMVLGGAEKLFKTFSNNIKPKNILTYCDYSKFTGQVYKKLGFKYLRYNRPSCHWVKDTKHITQAQLNEYGIDKLLGTTYGKGTNSQDLIIKEGFLPIYDCGQLVLEWIP